MNILSLNGGGTCGYMTALFLAQLEAETGKSCTEMFGLVSGVSTGSIIAAAIGKGIPAATIAQLYQNLATTIFKNKSWYPWECWYDSNKLEAVVGQLLTFQFNTCQTKVMIHATQVNAPNVIQPKFWKSWQEDNTVFANDIVVASCSAPIYFGPKQYKGNVYMDGGFVANNPSMCSIIEAICVGTAIPDIHSLNVNCGETPGFASAQDLNSILHWVPKIGSLPSLALAADARAVDYQAKWLLGANHVEVGPVQDLAMDNLNFQLMSDQASLMWKINKDAVLASIKLS